MNKLMAATAALAGLAGCTATVQTTLDAEAGSTYLASDFGAATVNNIAVQADGTNYVLILAQRFADEVPSMVNFAFDSANLGPEARAILDVQASWINQFPELRFSVYGHTDLVGSDAYNRRLGERRARAVVAYLASRGVSTDRLEALVSFGETQPLVLTQDPERANRRTVTQVSGFYDASAAGYGLNGKYAEVVFREYVESATAQSSLGASEGGEVAPQ
ncbi:OmpA family protein [Oceanicola granulosus HTCC2516]|uniref:OmpA family protein n=1 Tax=Oceanicola granulosus (strain ATCC BAA-861 / DSM 15982 / KCTC 12143 / HTCC2516) TaxID=314256 RepID=Q2CIE4_OCEGH|nr:OmpA family protein [Oceanicola granulosus]EAR52314.1 OmpA family protein [Oceanicola granulosus HTCC2516]